MIYLTNKASKNFINHNKRIFNRPKIDKKKIFLVEFNIDGKEFKLQILIY